MASPLFSQTNRTGSFRRAAKFRLSQKAPSSDAPSCHVQLWPAMNCCELVPGSLVLGQHRLCDLCLAQCAYHVCTARNDGATDSLTSVSNTPTPPHMFQLLSTLVPVPFFCTSVQLPLPGSHLTLGLLCCPSCVLCSCSYWCCWWLWRWPPVVQRLKRRAKILSQTRPERFPCRYRRQPPIFAQEPVIPFLLAYLVLRRPRSRGR